MDLQALRKECEALGLTLRKSLTNEPIVDGDPWLSILVVAAHGKTDADKELRELRDYLGNTDARWVEYVAARRRAVAHRRQQKYQQINGILLGAIADATALFNGDGYTLTLPKTAFDEWRTAVKRIKEEEPFEVSQ